MTILISYDKFTQCNKDLAEHQVANCALTLCNNTSLAKPELKKTQPKPTNCKGNWKMKLCRKLWVFLFKDIYNTGSQQTGKFVLKTLTSWHVSASLLDWRGIQCSIVLWVGWTLSIWEVWGRIPDTDYFFRAICFLGLCFSLLSLFCMGVFSHFLF